MGLKQGDRIAAYGRNSDGYFIAWLACVRGGSMIVIPPGPGNDRRLFESRKTYNWGLVILYSTDTAESRSENAVITITGRPG